MTDNMFDKFVKDKLGDHQSPVPQGLWDKIERKIDKEPKGGFFLPGNYLRAGLLLFAVTLGVLYFMLDNDTAEAGKQQTGVTAAANTNTSVIAETNNATGNDLHAGNEDHSSNEISGGDKENQHNEETTNINATTGNRSSKAAEGNEITRIIKAPKYVKGDSRKQVQFKNDGSYVKSDRRNNDNQADFIMSGNNSSYKENNHSGNAPNTGISTLPVSGNILSLSRGTTAYGFRSLGVDVKNNFDLSKLRLFGIDCPTTGTPRRNDWYLEVYGSPDITMKSVAAKGNTAYVQKKDSTESQQGGFTAGFRISKSIGENLLVKTGVQYSQINERFDLKTENERRIITVVTIRTIITPGGVDSTVRDTSTVEQIGYRLQRTYNRYRSIDIPLLLSYEFGNDKIKFGLNAGVILNLYSWYKGQALNDSLNVVSLNSKSTPIYKQNIGMGVYAGFSIIKPVSPKTEVFLEPYLRYNLSNMATGSAYTQKFHAAGVSLGIRYQFKGQRKTVK